MSLICAVASRHHRTRQRLRGRTCPTTGDLVLSAGSFLLCPDGITAIFNPPLDRFSRHVPWRLLPLSLSLTELAIMGEGEACQYLFDKLSHWGKLRSADEDLLQRLIGRVSWTEVGVDEDEILYETQTFEDAADLIIWGTGLASRCPFESVSRDLKQLPTMSMTELDRFALRQLQSFL